MSLFGITKAGLLSLTFAVGVLWTCVAAERVLTQRGLRDLTTSLRILKKLRENRPEAPMPVSKPFPEIRIPQPSAA